MKKLLALLLSVSLMLCGLILPAAAEGDTLIAVLASDPVSYNPDAAMDDPTLMVLENVLSKLICFDYAGNLMPDLATSWDVSEDGLTVTFHLREGVKWHDGEPFTSADVKWSLEKIAAEGYSSTSLANMTACDTPDDNTVVLTLAQPDSSLIYNLAYYGMSILPKHLYDGQDWLTCDAATVKPIGTGAYKFADHQKSVSVTLTANEDYYGEKPGCDTVIFSIIPDTNTAVQAFLNGEVDYLGSSAPASELENLAAQGANVYSRPFASRYYICYNMRREALQDANVRLAIAKAIDRQEILDKALSGQGQAAEGFAPIAIEWAYNGDDVVPAKDVEGAIALLENAGYTRDADGYFLTLTCPTMAGDDFVNVTTVVKAQLKEIGVNLVMNTMDDGAFVGVVMAEDPDFDLTIISGYAGPDASAMQTRVGTTGAMNLMGYSNPEVDECYTKANLTSNQDERAAYFKQAQKLLSEDLPIVPLTEVVITEVSASYLQDTPFSAPNLCTIGQLHTIKIVK